MFGGQFKLTQTVMGAHSPHLKRSAWIRDRADDSLNVPGSTEELSALGAPVTLRDGSRVRIRQWSPADRELLVNGFYRLERDDGVDTAAVQRARGEVAQARAT